MKLRTIKCNQLRIKWSRLFILLFLFVLYSCTAFYGKIALSENIDSKNHNNPKIAAVSYFVNLTNPLEVNNTNFFHNDLITVKGQVYNPFLGGGQPNVNVSLFIDGIDVTDTDPNAKNKTDINGNFTIITRIPMWTNIYHINIIIVNVTDLKTTQVNHHYEINSEATSQISFTELNTYPKTQGEKYKVSGYLTYDNTSGIPSMLVYPYWRFNGIDNPLSPLTTDAYGFFNEDINLPIGEWNSLSLALNFSGQSNINGSSTIFNNLRVFPNFTIIWKLPAVTDESANITIRGDLSSSIHPLIKLNNRTLSVYYDGSLLTTLVTNTTGGFAINFTVPLGNGSRVLGISLLNELGYRFDASITLNVTTPTQPGTPGGSPAGGLLIDPLFITILIVIIASIILGVYFYSKRQVAEGPIVKVPLENRLRNLTILKKTGRIEEAIVYLFYIFLDLTKAKYGVGKEPHDTINDYAIKCVKDMGQEPMIIYPFIKKIEKILYGTIGSITESNYDNVVVDFSTIFYSLTGVQVKL